ncbi:glycosyltransferase [Enterococcus avium]|jgi:UDP-D-galactose:(glucosyl)LPS alpha-1,6-D-galactosyltransferase|uniref:glycosyltransferase n=1 Tax=Enterococcus avium TaxID=33945 RepID=UPI002890B2D9|nr:glycosyltransferase [Enterococcus avium]MDT2490599.1 glycosyltransferase [Enterococcus avium]
MKNEVLVLANNLSGKGGTEVVISKFFEGFNYDNACYKTSLVIIDSLENSDFTKNIQNTKFYDHSVFKKMGKIGSFLFLTKILLQSKENVVICISPKITKIASTIKKIFKKKYKVVSWIHYSLESPYIRRVQKDLLSADYHFSITDKITNQFMKLQGNTNNVFTIYNPIEKSHNTIQTPEIPTFIFIGRLSSEKNSMELLQAAALLPKNLPWRIFIYGDGQEKSILENYVKENDLNSRVFFKGWLDNPWSNIKEASALVLTSKYEGFGMVLAESISKGLPVISSNCPVGPSDIINSENGFLYEMGDLNGLVDIFEKFIKNKVSFDRENLKNSISRFYEEEYFDNLFQSLIKICEDK